MVVSVFFGGFGGLLYGIAWLLLPDELDHRILLEEIIAGQWDWAFVGVILAIVIAGGFGFGVASPGCCCPTSSTTASCLRRSSQGNGIGLSWA